MKTVLHLKMGILTFHVFWSIFTVHWKKTHFNSKRISQKVAQNYPESTFFPKECATCQTVANSFVLQNEPNWAVHSYSGELPKATVVVQKVAITKLSSDLTETKKFPQTRKTGKIQPKKKSFATKKMTHIQQI